MGSVAAAPWRYEWSLPWVEMGLFLAVAALVAFLQATLFRHAGTFWRDEISTIQVARSSNLARLWSMLAKDSFPVVFAVLLRGWNNLAPHGGEAWIRLFGTAIALLLLGSLYVCGRWTTGRFPLIATALVGMNGNIFYYGSSIRAYGLAALATVLCFAAFWRFVEKPTRLNAALCVAARRLLMVHANYPEHIPVVRHRDVRRRSYARLRDRRWLRGFTILAICFVSALSMLVYLPIIAQFRDVTIIQVVYTDASIVPPRSYGKRSGKGDMAVDAIWAALLVIAPCLAGYSIYRDFREKRGPSLQLYGMVALVVSTVAGFIFFRFNRLYPYPWHFVPYIAFVAVVLDIGMLPRPDYLWMRISRLLVCCAVVVAGLLPAWELAHLSRSNMNVICDRLARDAAPDDLVVVNPFWLSPSFGYHYHGKARWITLPSLSRFDDWELAPWRAVKEFMTTPNPLEPTLIDIYKTLASGHRVWLVGKGSPSAALHARALSASCAELASRLEQQCLYPGMVGANGDHSTRSRHGFRSSRAGPRRRTGQLVGILSATLRHRLEVN